VFPVLAAESREFPSHRGRLRGDERRTALSAPEVNQRRETGHLAVARVANFVGRLDLRPRPINISVRISVQAAFADIVPRKLLILLVGRLATEKAS
jgi:hypothetical protein